MPTLVMFEKHEDGNEVQVGGVNLECDGCRTNLLAAGHDPFHDQGTTHCIVETIF